MGIKTLNLLLLEAFLPASQFSRGKKTQNPAAFGDHENGQCLIFCPVDHQGYQTTRFNFHALGIILTCPISW